MGWSLNAQLLSWDDGSTREAAVPSQYSAIAASLPPDGYPLLFRLKNGSWQADPQWLDDSKPRPRAPVIRVSGRGAT